MFRALLFVAVALLVPGAAAAEPSIQTEADAADTSLGVTVSDLDPAQTYWVTLVPPDTPEGEYDEFQYISGQTDSALSFQGVPGATEFRLHLKGAGDPLLARAQLAAEGTWTEDRAPGSDREIAFAQRYGLAGEWQGGYVCPDGAAEISTRLWLGPGGSYLGAMDVTLVDGDNAGGTGRWPLIVNYTEPSRTVAITPDSPESEPFERYGMAQISGATLSRDGLRIENGALLRHGCSDFHLARAPLPEPQMALAEAAQLAESGFGGTWQGEYQCGAQMALDLGFARHPAAGFPLVRWRYREAGPTPGFDGEIEFQVKATGPGEVRLYPLGWVKQPSGHRALPVTLRIAPDGRKMAGEIEGCGPVSLEQTDDTPVTAGLIETGALTGLAGTWTGIGQCHGEDQIMQLDLADLSMGDGAAEFRYAEVTGFIPGAWQKLQIAAGADGTLSARLLENVVRRQGHEFGVPAQLVRQDDGLQIRFAGDLCQPVTLALAETPLPLTVTPADGPQDFAFVAMGEDQLRAAPPAALCTSMRKWAAQLQPDEASMSHDKDFASWPAIFADDKFTPFMGLPYDRLRASPQVGQALLAPLRDECRDLGQDFPFFSKVINAAFGLDRNSDLFASDAQRFRAAVSLAQRDSAALAPLLDRIAALPVDDRMTTALQALRAESETLSNLTAGDRTRVADRIAARQDEAQQSENEAWLTALADGREPSGIAALSRAEQILATAPAQTRDAWRDRLQPRAAEVAGTIDDAAAAGAADLRVYPVIASRLDALAEQAARRKQDALQTLRDRLDDVAEIAGLRPVFQEISALGGAEAQGLWPLYDRKAGDLLAEAVASLPAEHTAPQADPALSKGGLAGLRNNALLTAFLSGDRMVPYRADRDTTLIYLQQLTGTFNTYCPAALPSDLPRLIAGQFIDLDALTGSRDQMAAQGLQNLLQGLQTLADPGPAVAEAMRRDEIMLMADGDAQILLNSLNCTGPELRTMFENIRLYVRDPAKEIPAAAQSMADICIRALDDGMIMNETRAYCRCSGTVLEAASEDLQRYVRADPPRHYRQISFLDRSVNRNLQSCRQPI